MLWHWGETNPTGDKPKTVTHPSP
ncbi:unnamed protein product [Spirodela intermedia]|uniref:Uncharacterized protein n=1 Tax=Spirodela intermedia TaxID=51605 RepID=A0A7I8IQT6_SPIIN|nr:unnamed protein product [Spirodela intermedia]CAA6660338.1 unnamed protein product [Spirodela intermedia]